MEERVLMTMPEEWKDREAAYGEWTGVFRRLKEHCRAVRCKIGIEEMEQHWSAGCSKFKEEGSDSSGG